MGKLKCILCSPWTCCGSGRAIHENDLREHHKSQLGGLDQAIRSINLGQNNYTRQIDESNHEVTFSTTSKAGDVKDNSYQSADLEPYKKTQTST